MGLLDSLRAEVERLNPANIVNEVEAARERIAAFESRIEAVETFSSSLVSVVQQAVPVLEAAFPQAAPEVATLISAMKLLQGAAASTTGKST